MLASDDTQFATAVEPVSQLIDLAGCTSLSMKVSDKVSLVSSMCHFHVIDRASLAMNQ